MRNITTVAFDADDTLWQNEQFFRATEARFCAMLSEYGDAAAISAALLANERRSLHLYGYGVKGFILSMIETAAQRASPDDFRLIAREILALGKEMLAHPIELLPGVVETLEALKPDYQLMVITKGDLFHQERKLEASGLAQFFQRVEIVSEKNAETYRRIFDDHGRGASRAVMIGNSVRSDILPALEAGAHAVHIPHALTWAHEHADTPDGHPRFRTAQTAGEVEAIIRSDFA